MCIDIHLFVEGLTRIAVSWMRSGIHPILGIWNNTHLAVYTYNKCYYWLTLQTTPDRAPVSVVFLLERGLELVVVELVIWNVYSCVLTLRRSTCVSTSNSKCLILPFYFHFFLPITSLHLLALVYTGRDHCNWFPLYKTNTLESYTQTIKHYSSKRYWNRM